MIRMVGKTYAKQLRQKGEITEEKRNPSICFKTAPTRWMPKISRKFSPGLMSRNKERLSPARRETGI
jgi:hypothetical protein